MSRTHDYYLDQLVWNLSLIDERIRDISWIMKDGVWFRERKTAKRKFCDLIIVYESNYAVPVELKGSTKKRGYALKQIESGRKFIEDKLGMWAPYGKFVWFTQGNYQYETIDFGQMKLL